MNHWSGRMRGEEAGMTLIEVLAVVVLITLIMVTVSKTVFSKSNAAKAQLNVTKMNTLKGYLGQYRLQFNSYPSALNNLVHGGPELKNTGQIFTPLADEQDLVDVFGVPYQYQAENNGRSFVLKTLGADGVAGGDGANQDVEVRP